MNRLLRYSRRYQIPAIQVSSSCVPRVLAETDQAEQAVDLIDRVIRMTGGDAKLVISKANLEIKLGRIEDAEQTLQDALNAQPTSEPIYEALLSLYDPAPGKPSVVQDQTAKWRILVKRLLGTIPNSRTGRLVQAQLYDASRNYDRAAAILEGLLAENPGRRQGPGATAGYLPCRRPDR